MGGIVCLGSWQGVWGEGARGEARSAGGKMGGEGGGDEGGDGGSEGGGSPSGSVRLACGGAAVVGESSAVEGWAVGGESWRLLAAWADDTIMASIELPTACACGCACGCCGGGS